jgi:DNA-binding protein H-NS
VDSPAGGQVMKPLNFRAMSVDELWQIYEQINRLLAERLTSEKRQLEHRLSRLRGDLVNSSPAEVAPRSYPKVRPKYQNPSAPFQTWSGRGNTPRWIEEMIEAGGSLDDLRIPETTYLTQPVRSPGDFAGD